MTPVVQFHYRVDPLLFFPDLDLAGLDPGAWYLRPPYCEDGFLVVDIGAFVVRTPERTLLVDAGVGNGKARPNACFDRRADEWLVAPGEIDTVVFTHLHVDHVGFATRFDGSAWVPAFPDARHLTTAAELEYWTGTDPDGFRERLGDYVGDSVLPLRAAGLLDVVAPDHRICPEVRLLPAPGHTPGNVCVEVVSEGRRAVFAGDMVHHPLQLARPSLSTDFCVHGACATHSREALLRDVADTDTLLFPAHFPDAVPGRVVTDPAGGYRYEPVTR
ncbi:MBL fold metallo-hydrolase [Pseudonocardia sp. CA-107938]|uniref:MBL fold metallo-hydrolase n=1 Tax=Pseudonocardia sp. CA-107938 TaxID=3240021 RepID=UPI003D90810D